MNKDGVVKMDLKSTVFKRRDPKNKEQIELIPIKFSPNMSEKNQAVICKILRDSRYVEFEEGQYSDKKESNQTITLIISGFFGQYSQRNQRFRITDMKDSILPREYDFNDKDEYLKELTNYWKGMTYVIYSYNMIEMNVSELYKILEVIDYNKETLGFNNQSLGIKITFKVTKDVLSL